MSPATAVVAFWAFILWAIRRDARLRPPFAASLWVPFLWLLVLASRPVSYWLGVGASDAGELSGNAFDRNIYLVFWFIALVILNKAGIDWRAVIADNWPIVLFYGFLLASCLWADAPFVAFKRWFKDLSAVFVGLVILAQREPREALEAVFVRVALVLLPVSVLLTKYFPEHGRRYGVSGGLEVTGVTDQKNSLGALILVLGILAVWGMADRARNLDSKLLRKRNLTGIFILVLGGGLLWQADSKTAALCLAVGAVIVLADRIPLIGRSPRAFLSVAIAAPVLFGIANHMTGLSGRLFNLLGRDATLTNRTKIWQAVREQDVDPVFGEGYLMFWDTHSPILVDGMWVPMNTAHNGYLDVYLDGGWFGVLFLVLMLVGVGISVCREFLTGSHLGKLQLAFFVVVLIYNYSESNFARRGILWFAFLMFCANYGRAFAARSLSRPPAEGDE